MIQYDIKIPSTAINKEIFFDQNTNKLSYKDDLGIIVAFAPSTGLPSLLEYNETNATIWNNGKGNISTNTSFGESALSFNTTGSENTAFGYRALNLATTAVHNTVFGSSSAVTVTGFYNTIMGSNAAFVQTTANYNTIIGAFSGYGITTGSFNTILGDSAAGYLTTGSNNIAIGEQSLQNTSIGSRNVAVGRYTATAANNTTDTVLLGDACSGASHSIVIGSNGTDDYFGSCIVIGRSAIATAANQFVIGSASYPVGTITTESLTGTKTWRVKINGVDYKILLA